MLNLRSTGSRLAQIAKGAFADVIQSHFSALWRPCNSFSAASLPPIGSAMHELP